MIRRVQRIAARSRPPRPPRPGRLSRAGTFHSVGARLLREFAGRIGLDPAFTIHDRGDSGDLHGTSSATSSACPPGKRFPLKGTCLAIYSAAVDPGLPHRRPADPLSLVCRLGRRAAQTLPRLRPGQTGPAGARLRRPDSSTGPQMVAEPDLARERWAAASATSWWTSSRTPTACRPAAAGPAARRARPHRGG